jgi:hypothetical protein
MGIFLLANPLIISFVGAVTAQKAKLNTNNSVKENLFTNR